MENLDTELKEIYKKDVESKIEEEPKQTEEPKIEKKETKVEDKPKDEPKVEEKPKVENKLKEEEPKVEEKPLETKKEELPRGIKTVYADEWQKLPESFKSEVKRSLETKDTYIKTLEERNTALNKAVGTAEVQIQEVIKNNNLPREQVIGNMLSWVSSCQIDPDNTLCNALGQGAIQLKNPEGFIRFVANKYKLNLNDMVVVDPRQASLQDENARLKMQEEARSKQYQHQSQMQEFEEGRKIENSIETFKSNHLEINNDLFATPTFQNHMSYAIEKIKVQEPNNNDFLDLLEKAYKIIERDYNTNNQQNNQTDINPSKEIKKPLQTITKTTGLKSSSPVSRTVPKEYSSKREMEQDLDQDLKNIYKNNNK
jgi:hypothetical protein